VPQSDTFSLKGKGILARSQRATLEQKKKIVRFFLPTSHCSAECNLAFFMILP
jgi:hypothetical protein